MSPSVGAPWPAPKIELSIGLQHPAISGYRSLAEGLIALLRGLGCARVDLKPQKRTEAFEDPTAEAPPSYLHFVYGDAARGTMVGDVSYAPGKTAGRWARKKPEPVDSGTAISRAFAPEASILAEVARITAGSPQDADLTA